VQLLLIEDHVEVSTALGGFLTQRGFVTRVANNGLEGLRLFHRQRPDAVLLDIMMPGMTGLEVLREIRESSQVPVLVLTARADEREILEGFHLGADDYITKPFRMFEVLARIQAVLRRSGQTKRILHGANHLTLDLEARLARLQDTVLDLTVAEFELLQRLLNSPNRVFTRSELVEVTSNERETLERTVDTHIKNIRKKIGQPHHLETVYGIGYRYAL
jgi:two-component system, OmpR family, response regulator AdeR